MVTPERLNQGPEFLANSTEFGAWSDYKVAHAIPFNFLRRELNSDALYWGT